jgi:endonuclease YncB( thermonuclease family)
MVMFRDDALDQYEGCNMHNTPEFGLKGWCGWVRVVDVYDGDTCIVILKHFHTLYKVHLRIDGIDTPELRSKHPVLKVKAIEARNAVVKYVTSDEIVLETNGIYTRAQVQNMLSRRTYIVWVVIKEQDKYGRMLADIFHDENCDKETGLSDFLVKGKYAVSYGGGKKLTDEQQLAVLGL